MSSSTTVEIQQEFQSVQSGWRLADLQQQKSSRSFRAAYKIMLLSIYNSRNLVGVLEWREHRESERIYNSRNLVGVLEEYFEEMDDGSTTVEIQQEFQSTSTRKIHQNLQQQKSSRSFRARPIGSCSQIYNSRNLVGVLEIQLL